MWMLNLMHSLPSDRYTDRPLKDRNIILMCRITAMAHLGAAVLFFLDVSTGLQSLEGISEEDMKLVKEIKSEATRTLAAQEGEATIDADLISVAVMWTSVEEGFINPSARNIVISAKTARELIQRMEDYIPVHEHVTSSQSWNAEECNADF
ncbi:hypothetical protein DKX38_015101 [Salix brachista]|uniref:Uncharacterized protein n=1 Tax=Salix brachista TaxID=2182728 RepID=A0A5N5L503_9ROSI|nr:hypothetical protein DKX38_015101 [Salix brachista]